MEVWTGICMAAAALSALTVAWKMRQDVGSRRGRALCGVVLAAGVGAGLFFSPVLGLILVCSSFLILRTDTQLATDNKAVLVTGCDSGFGHALAKLLSEMGVQVFAGVLDENGGGAQRLRERCRGNLQVLQLDVTDHAQVEAAHRYIRTQVADTGLWGLVNNAGVLQCPADSELQPMASYRRCLEVNFLSAVHMCQVFLPLLRRARGRIVNVCSLAGAVPMPMFGAYGASKAALSVFSGAMRLELLEWGVDVVIIQPAGFRTEIFGNEDTAARYRAELLAAASPEARQDYGDTYISSLPRSLSLMSRQSVEDVSPVVDAMRHALLAARPLPLYAPGQMGWLLPFLHRYCPTAMFDAIVARLLRQTECRPAGLQRT